MAVITLNLALYAAYAKKFKDFIWLLAFICVSITAIVLTFAIKAEFKSWWYPIFAVFVACAAGVLLI